MHQLDQMMLHEAVMLEIYRQALSARDTSSPRCLSRNSSNDGNRCPSADSNYSGRQSSNAANSAATSPIALPIPQILPATLLPSQSAAMAAYLATAAAAQNRLLLGSHALGLSRDQSPPFLPLQSPISGDTPVLDFSTKRKSQDYDDMDREQHNKSNDNDDTIMKSDNDPLDLSVSSRKRSISPSLPPPSSHGRKVSRNMDYKPSIASPWSSPPIASYFASSNTSSTSPSPKNHHLSHSSDWNGMKNKISTPNDATKALEKMSELSRLGGNDVGRQTNNSSSSGNSASTGRHSAWQSHWLNKGADSVKDVFKCVWCKQSFPTLETLTIHMKETQHLGVNMDSQRSHNHQSQATHNSHSNQNHSSSNTSSSTSSNAPSKSDLHLMIKETMPLPRKLVRGQDVWLGKGAEQTRQILKCMWCGQSFRSLSEMTTHMQQTQHYTNIISQEQIISWKSTDDGKTGSSSNTNTTNSNGSNAASGSISTVSAVLTCKVCDQAFSSLKDLSNHMVKNAHYKEHIMRSISESGGRRRQTREKRKKSLPVRKLLEIERAQSDYKNGDNSSMAKSMRDSSSNSGRITCEKCGDKIDTSVFVEHIRQCIGAAADAQRNLLKNNILMPDSLTSISRDGRKSIGGDDSNASHSSRLLSPNLSSKESVSNISDKTGSPSVLNAIEQLIEKSFDTRSRHVGSNYQQNTQQNAPLGSSILKRLGIDESVDYTKPLIDSQTMNLLRGFSQQSSSYSQRERSASESSSVSDRGSSVLEASETPERRTDSVNNGQLRETPDKSNQYDDNENEAISLKIKREHSDEHHNERIKSKTKDVISVKKEMTDDENERDDRQSENVSRALLSPSMSSKRSNSVDEQRTPLASPISDAASQRSTPDNANKKSKQSIATSSLGALSSMFDNLTGANSSKSHESGGKKTNSNPLAALQKLCDKTENTNPINKSNNSQNQQLAVPIQSNNNTSNAASGAMLAFSWACNDAIVNAATDSIKCAFCDTPFSSKGAYRHHLSKVHFVKDEHLLEPIIAKAQKISATHSRRTPPSQAQSPKSVSSSASSSGNGPNNRLSKSPTPPSSSALNSNLPSNASQSSTSATNFDESPHSKFLKYTELAKQLSSKYV